MMMTATQYIKNVVDENHVMTRQLEEKDTLITQLRSRNETKEVKIMRRSTCLLRVLYVVYDDDDDDDIRHLRR